LTDSLDQYNHDPHPTPEGHVMDEQTVKGGRPAPAGPKWEATVRDRLRAGIRKFSRPLADLVDRDANEGDTRLLVTDFLCDVLGFDKYEDLTTEYQVKGEFADYGVRIDKELVAFIETKRVATKLAEKHLRQVQMYAVNEGVEWVILTNGVEWQAYHLDASGGLPVLTELVLSVNLVEEGSRGQRVEGLFYLSREALRKRQINELWERTRATSPKTLARILVAAPVAEAIRKELRRQTGQRVEPNEVVKLLRDTIIRPEALE
jgi:hypothetical protein